MRVLLYDSAYHSSEGDYCGRSILWGLNAANNLPVCINVVGHPAEAYLSRRLLHVDVPLIGDLALEQPLSSATRSSGRFPRQSAMLATMTVHQSKLRAGSV